MVSVSCSAVTLLSSFHNNGSDSLHRRGRTDHSVSWPDDADVYPHLIQVSFGSCESSLETASQQTVDRVTHFQSATANVWRPLK